ncbi:MAG: histidine ammonia-lyase [Bacteroidetes bacterium]|nr:histidine ammonia-lyase [Bacteroidota bacterium]
MATHSISAAPLTFEVIESILSGGKKLSLSVQARKKISNCRNYLDKKIKESKEQIYGINTGFGALYNQTVSKNDLEKLQHNLVMSHACGTGEEVPRELVRLMLLLKIQGLSYGHSGVAVSTVERLIAFYNNDILPVVYQQGSLGASGDLSPLAHLSLPLIGEGEVLYQGKKQSAKNVLKKLGWDPLHLQSKEGLALLNGTQFMSAYGTWCVLESFRLSRLADFISAISIDAFDGRIEPFNHLLHGIRKHDGQVQVAEHIRGILKGSKIISRKKEHVQDPYSFRCIPQVHGASYDAIRYAAMIFETEINSVTDNPTIFPKENIILSGGNFHGQPLALALDFLAIALSELGSISERRTYQLISGQRGLPPFLVSKPGLNSGFMIPQYTAASVASQNKQLCSPASVDSIVSSNGQEDHVSMGANAATKVFRVVKNLETILSIELMTAAQALDFRRPAKSSPAIESFMKQYRKQVKFVAEDRILFEDIAKTRTFLSQ